MAKAFRPARTAFSAVFLLLVFGFILSRKPPPEANPKFAGTTFGTVPFKVLTADANLEASAKLELARLFSAELDAINREMSTWRPDSELSRFNATNRTDWVTISTNFATVVRAALRFAAETDGAFDPVAGVQKEKYHHGPATGAPTNTPTAFSYRDLTLQDRRLRKSDPALRFDLDAIAKGYAVDRVCEVLTQRGVTNHLVEIGGEVRTRGISPKGAPWPVFISVPRANGGVYQKLTGANHAVATSGNAYQSRHIIDPTTGASVTNALRSVTVITPSCIEADTLATAYFVMGRQRGLAHANARPDTEALFLYVEDGVLQEAKSDGFP